MKKQKVYNVAIKVTDSRFVWGGGYNLVSAESFRKMRPAKRDRLIERGLVEFLDERGKSLTHFPDVHDVTAA